MSAVALNSMLWQVSRMLIPALGGVVIALSGTWVVFAAGAAGFVAMSRVMAGFAPTDAAKIPLAVGHSGRQFLDGFRFIRLGAGCSRHSCCLPTPRRSSAFPTFSSCPRSLGSSA